MENTIKPAFSSQRVAANGKCANKGLSDHIADRLRDEIISGKLISGSSLVETAISAQYKVSRNSVREAMRQLLSEGLIHYVRYRGAIVRTLTPADVRDIYRVRRILEHSAIERSAFARDDLLESILKTVQAQEQAATANHWREVGTLSLRFHQALVALLESERLNVFFKTIVAQLRLVFALFEDEQEFQSIWVPKDRQLYESLIRGHRQEADNVMRSYLEQSEARVLDTIRTIQAKT